MDTRSKQSYNECALPDIEKPPLPSPPCFTSMQARLLEYDTKKVKVTLPVLESYMNPADTMQGGLISAAFDNVFGPLCLLATGTPHTAALNIATTYHRPLFCGDDLIITATVQSHGKTAIHMIAEGYNQNGKLVATSSSSYIIKQNT